MIPLWAIGTGLASVAAGLGYGLSEGKKNTASNPYNVPNNVPNNPQPKIAPMDLLDEHIQREQERVKEQQRIRADISGDLGLTPEWVDRVAKNRSDDKYQQWLENSNEFVLGGKRYKWVDEDKIDLLTKGKEFNEMRDVIADQYARENHRDGGQYQGSYRNLMNDKYRLTGKRYVPVRIS
jgi:hypothetical protein